MNLTALKKTEQARWDVVKMLPKWQHVADDVGDDLFDAKDRYEAVSALTGVPWFIIAVIHQRESSQSWRASLAQGDPWNRMSIHVPKGRGPFSSWEMAAVDALKHCPPHAAAWRDWSPGGALTLLVQYNGLGYASGPVAHGHRYPPQSSPYLWSGTDQYRKGKYVADGHFDPDTVDKQLGCVPMLLRLMKRDPSIWAPSAALVATTTASPTTNTVKDPQSS